jgi:hypothetical protein
MATCLACLTEWDLLKLILEELENLAPSTTIQSGSKAIGSGVDTVTVTFPEVFDHVPDVVVSISRPAAEDLIDVNIDEASISATGFTVSLGTHTGSANYKLKWIAN